MTGIILALVVLVPVVFVLLAIPFASYVFKKYEYRVFFNWANVWYVVGLVFAFASFWAFIGGMDASRMPQQAGNQSEPELAQQELSAVDAPPAQLEQPDITSEAPSDEATLEGSQSSGNAGNTKGASSSRTPDTQSGPCEPSNPTIKKGFNTDRAYPHLAVSRGIEGKVKVQYTVGADGKVSSVEIISADPPGVFEKDVTKEFYRMEWEPAKDSNCNAVNSEPVTQSVVFRLG